MTAAHYIALLLLSTAAKGSREHVEIIEQNGPGVWVALAADQLVVRSGEQGLWHLTERGNVLVTHVLMLPLPVLGWRMMPGVSGPVMPRMPMVEVTEVLPIPGSVTWVTDADIDGGMPPPKPPTPRPIPGVTPAADPLARRQQALELMNRGCGTSEIADTLGMPQSEVEQIFFGGA